MDWKQFCVEIQASPPLALNARPPCADALIESTTAALGPMPSWLVAMLKTFNGAELCVGASANVTLFGISNGGEAIDWFVDRFTEKWRAHNHRDGDWTFAMTSYGGLLVARQNGAIKEWDTGPAIWLQEWSCIEAAAEWMLREAKQTAAELKK